MQNDLRAALIASGAIRPGFDDGLTPFPRLGTGLRLDDQALKTMHRPHTQYNLRPPNRRRKRKQKQHRRAA